MPFFGNVFIPKETIAIREFEDKLSGRFYSQFFAALVFIGAVFYLIVKWEF